MTKNGFNNGLTRRELLRLSAAGATALGASLSFPSIAAAAGAQQVPVNSAAGSNLYSQLLQSWCDGLIAHQITTIQDPGVYGALLCPACGIIHGRCGDAVYPLLRVAHTTGDSKYLHAALHVHEWSEKNVSRGDGSWVNDVTLSSWKGITVFHTIALAEALHHHGTILDTATRRQWTERLRSAAKFLDGFISIQTGNINYPITSSLAFALCGQVLNDAHYTDRAQKLAHETLEHFTQNGFIAGEGHPLNAVTAKGCRPVDLGYNVEESLPALALYALLTNDAAVMTQAVASMRTHMEFMLPDGGWDNSWGSRNYKWSYWGSRTSDGCQPAYALLANHDSKFHEVAQRNLELMAACTHNNLLYGGPDYFAHGEKACIHHNFTHAKALATVLDRGNKIVQRTERVALPRDAAYGLKSYPEIGTHLVALGDWRATVTENDFNYVEDVQTSGSSPGGGHATGGALTMLYHQTIGPVLTASMTEYALVEISNQQVTREPQMTLTPRIEFMDGKRFTSLSDFKAELKVSSASDKTVFEARGRMLNAAHQPPAGGDVHYHLTYSLSASGVEIVAEVQGSAPESVRFVLPILATTSERVEQNREGAYLIHKRKGTLRVERIDGDFNTLLEERAFNLVPGFECAPLTVSMKAGVPIRIQIKAL